MMTTHLYPGMGAKGSMYPEPWRKLDYVQIHDWPRWQGESSIAEIARRLIDEHEIIAGDRVIGTSLGAVVGCEVANMIELEELVLVGGAICPSEINSLLKLLHPLVDVTPIHWLQFSSGKIPHELSAMFSDSDPDFMRHMCKAIFSWEGLRSEVPLTRIHGRKDCVISPPEDVDVLIDGGHLIAMTHADEVLAHIL